MNKGAVLISGAAGGIGAATVDRFLASGYDVAGIDLSPSVETLRPDRYTGRVADVTKPEEIAAAVDELLDGVELRHIDSLAGAVVPGERDLARERDLAAATRVFDSSLAVNLTGQFTLIRAALPRLERTEGDRSIALCSSVNALRGYGVPGYSSAKAGLIGLMHSFAQPLAALGIRINAVAPGTTRTPALDEDVARAGDPAMLDKVALQIPLGRIAEPDDVAAVFEALAVRLIHVTDEVIRVDGGQVLAKPADPPPRGLRRLRAGVRRRLHNRPLR